MVSIVVAGHICLDITPVFPGGAGQGLRELLVPGGLLHVEPAHVHTGGAVANTGLALKKMGADVVLMGKLGEDAFGAMVLDMLRGQDAAGGMICSGDSATSYTVVLAPPDVDRVFLHHPGANDTFCFDDLNWDAIASADLFHFGYPPLMRRMYENGGDELAQIFAAAKRQGVATSLDMASIDEHSAAGEAGWEGILQRVLPHVDFFVPSAEELVFMLNPPLCKTLQARAAGRDFPEVLDIERDLRRLAGRLLAMGCRVAMVKCGARGIYYQTSDAAVMRPLCSRLSLCCDEWADKAGFVPAFVPDAVCSATGAGDTAIATFLAALTQGYALETCVTLAAAQGACCVASYDALGNVHSLRALQEKIDGGWVRRLPEPDRSEGKP